ncbi:acyltransferase family protein [Nigerium massiliense]|uniref:acyltransferase family protein n=1 Tax=Nigerium massiliense TaxID=1522317 RepID=UPI0005917070|nr:acyltransferase [Nigerium massiliense]
MSPTATQTLAERTIPATPPTGLGGGSRIGWLDLARGVVVVMVVLFHVIQYQYLPLTDGIDSRAPGLWENVNAVLGAIRMPALLVLSGWLAAKTVSLGLGKRKTWRRIGANAYLYVLWLAVYAGVTVTLGAQDVAQAVRPEAFFGELLIPYSTLWFLAALVWYTLVLAAVHRLPRFVVLAGALGVSAVAGVTLSTDQGLWVRIPELFVYFVIGAYAHRLWPRVGRRPGLAVLGGASVVFASLLGQLALAVEMAAEPQVWDTRGGDLVGFVIGVVGALGGVLTVFGLASFMEGLGGVSAKTFTWVGRHTLSVYVVHYPILVLLTVAESGPLYDLPRHVLETHVGLWLYPLVATVVIVAASLTFESVARALGMHWLFQLPGTRRPAKASGRASVEPIGQPGAASGAQRATRSRNSTSRARSVASV